jgi:uroporphyrin-3 C-methyltransferase/uroporphyrinogen III methyltransferase/synthase
MSSQRVDRFEQGAIQRLDGSDRRLIEAESSVKRFQDQVRDLQQRQGVIDTRIAEAQSLYTQVEKLYRGLIQESADALLAEVESTLMLAAQQLSLAVEPRGALIALEQIETRLARQNDATLAGLRRALGADIERLRAYPATEIAALAMRLDQQVAQIEQWPLTASVAKRERAGSAEPGAPAGTGAAETRAEGAAGAWLGIRQLADDLQRLIRVRRVDNPESLLIAPDQAYFIRENLRLMLLNTRLALLSRNQALFRADLDRVIDSLSRYFDTDNRSVAQALLQLRQLRGTRLTLEPPLPTESLAAVRAVRASRSARD